MARRHIHITVALGIANDQILRIVDARAKIARTGVEVT